MLTLVVRGAARQSLPTPLRRVLRGQVGRAMRAAAVGDAEVCLSLTDDEEILALNRQFAFEDHATDVLSFAQAEAILPQGLPAAHAAAGPVLGDIVISLDTAARQAQAAGHELLHELLHLSVHGLCHLLGYDHATAAQEQVMFGYEALLREQARGAGRIVPVAAPPRVATGRRRSPG